VLKNRRRGAALGRLHLKAGAPKSKRRHTVAGDS